jgi:signal transduction histidine kinase
VEELIGKRFHDVMPQEVAERRLKIGRKAINEKQAQIFEDEREGRHFQNIFSPVEILGQEETFQVVSRDITGRKQMEEKLKQLYESERKLRQELEAEIETRVKFTKVLVHELRTPLTPVLASSELLVAELQQEPW